MVFLHHDILAAVFPGCCGAMHDSHAVVSRSVQIQLTSWSLSVTLLFRRAYVPCVAPHVFDYGIDLVAKFNVPTLLFYLSRCDTTSIVMRD